MNGSVMVISAIDTDKKERCVMAGATGYAATLSIVIADQMTSKDETPVGEIIKKGIALACLYKAVGGDETLESNNQ